MEEPLGSASRSRSRSAAHLDAAYSLGVVGDWTRCVVKGVTCFKRSCKRGTLQLLLPHLLNLPTCLRPSTPQATPRSESRDGLPPSSASADEDEGREAADEEAGGDVEEGGGEAAAEGCGGEEFGGDGHCEGLGGASGEGRQGRGVMAG